MTDRAQYIVSVKEYENGEPWLMFDWLDGENLPLLRNGFMGIDLREGTTLEQAKELAGKINDLMVGISYTKL